MQSRSLLSATVALLSIIPCAGCSSGSSPSVIADPPSDSGVASIDMTGTWEIQDVQLIESTATVSLPPVAGTVIELSAAAVVGVNGDPVARIDIEAGYGHPLDYYVNSANGRFVMFGYKITDAGSGAAFEGAFAGGVMTASRIEVESVWRARAGNGGAEQSERYRYALVRQTVATVRLEVEGLRGVFPAATAVGVGHQRVAEPRTR